MRNFIDRVDIDTVFYNLGSNIKIADLYEKILQIEPVSERQVAKQCLEKLKERINEQIDGGYYPPDSYNRGWDEAMSAVLDIIDELTHEDK